MPINIGKIIQAYCGVASIDPDVYTADDLKNFLKIRDTVSFNDKFVECFDSDEISEVKSRGKVGYIEEYHRDGYSYIVDEDGFRHHNLAEFKAYHYFTQEV